MSRKSKNRNTRVPHTNRRLSFRPNSFPVSRSLQSPTFLTADLSTPFNPAKLRRSFAPRVIPAVVHQNVPAGPRPFKDVQLPSSPAELQKTLTTCVRRNQRREVMFAKGGAGSRKMSRPVHTPQSKERC